MVGSGSRGAWGHLMLRVACSGSSASSGGLLQQGHSHLPSLWQSLVGSAASMATQASHPNASSKQHSNFHAPAQPTDPGSCAGGAAPHRQQHRHYMTAQRPASSQPNHHPRPDTGSFRSRDRGGSAQGSVSPQVAEAAAALQQHLQAQQQRIAETAGASSSSSSAAAPLLHDPQRLSEEAPRMLNGGSATQPSYALNGHRPATARNCWHEERRRRRREDDDDDDEEEEEAPRRREASGGGGSGIAAGSDSDAQLVREKSVAAAILGARSAWQAVCAVEAHKDELTPVHVSQALVRFSRLLPPRGGSRAAGARQQEREGEGGRSVGKSTWNKRTSAVMRLLLSRVEQNAEAFDARGLSTSASSLAKLRALEPEPLSAIARAAVRRAPEMSAQNLAQTVWAFAKLGLYDPALFGAIGGQVVARVDELEPQHVANVCWAFAKVGDDHPGLFEALAEAAEGCADLLLPQQMSAIAWSFATLRIGCLPLLSALARQIEAQAENLSPQGVANVAWAYASLGVADRPLFSALALAASRHASTMAPQNAANTLWAFAALGELDHTDAIMESVGAAALRHAARRGLTPQGLANTCWALAVFDVLDAERLRGLIPALRAATRGLEHRAWTQVFLAELAARSSSGSGNGGSGSLRPVLPAELLEHAEASWRRRNPPGTEKWCPPVAMALDDLGLTRSIQEAPPGNGQLLHPDFVLELSGQRLALQVDTESYHACNNQVMLGRTLLMHRLLRRIGGMTVVGLPVHEWEGLQRDPLQLADYVSKKIGSALGSAAAAGDGQ